MQTELNKPKKSNLPKKKVIHIFDLANCFLHGGLTPSIAPTEKEIHLHRLMSS